MDVPGFVNAVDIIILFLFCYTILLYFILMVFSLNWKPKSASQGGTGLPHTMDVYYDSGCSRMALSLSNAQSFLRPNAVQNLPIRTSQTASGPAQSYRVTFQVRHLSRDGQKELVHWHPVRCNCYRNSSNLRIFRGTLERDMFMANQPHLQRLYVAHTRAQLLRSLPKGC